MCSASDRMRQTRPSRSSHICQPDGERSACTTFRSAPTRCPSHAPEPHKGLPTRLMPKRTVGASSCESKRLPDTSSTADPSSLPRPASACREGPTGFSLPRHDRTTTAATDTDVKEYLRCGAHEDVREC